VKSDHVNFTFGLVAFKHDVFASHIVVQYFHWRLNFGQHVDEFHRWPFEERAVIIPGILMI